MGSQDETKGLSQQIEKFDQLIIQLMHELHLYNSVEFMDKDLTPGQFIAGAFIQQNKSCTMSEIANVLGVSLSAITGIIDRMVKHGFVERMRDDMDRRLVRVQLTGKGTALIDQMNVHRYNDLRVVLEVLNEEDRLTFLSIIQKIISSVQQQRQQKANQ